MQSKVFTKEWFKAASIRSLRTMAQTSIGIMSTGVILSDVNWIQCISASLLAGLLSFLMSISNLPEIEVDE